jgi:hypothetical protein
MQIGVYVDGRTDRTLNPDGSIPIPCVIPGWSIALIRLWRRDGEQNRSVMMDFERITSNRRTNTKAEAAEEWFAMS